MPVCSAPACPTIVSASGRCEVHARAHEQRRGSRQQRGYDARHDSLRRAEAKRVRTGRVKCWRCGELITPDEPWDLGHDDQDRTRYRGPEHANRCNRSAAGRASHR